MIVIGNEVTLTKKELDEIIVECSAKANGKYGVDDHLFTLIQGLLTVGLVKEVHEKIFGEEK